MKWSFIVSFLLVHSVNGQFPNFLKAFYGGGSSTTKKPPILRRNFQAENALLDDPFNVPSVPNNGIITGGQVGPTPGPGLPGTFNNIPLSNAGQLQNNYVVTQNSNNNLKQSGPSLVNGNGGGGIVNAPNSFSSSPSDFSDSSWPLSQPDLPKITNIQVQCEKNAIRVNVDFDRPFFGMVFSKGHFSDPNCVHLQSGSGATSAVFEIELNECGMTSSGGFQTDNGQPNPAGSFIESTIIVQYDSLVQEVWDQARKLRCTWYDYYEKSVTFRPFQVNMLNAVTANFLGDNLQCWMQIQSGKGPWSSEVSGIVKIGQTMTMVLGIKDEENKFDMVVRNCVAHDGKRSPIQLVNELGCVIRPKIMSKFQKIKNFGSAATVVSYAYFQAFKFPDSMNVHFQCVIQVCRYNCPEPVCPDEGTGGASLPTGVQASVTASPAFSSNSVGPTGLGQLSAPGGGGPSDTFAVNPRTPSVLPATRRQYRKIPARFNARDGREQRELFDFSDTNGYSIPHQYNMKNPYYQGYQNHRVKRHEKAMKKASLGEVNTNSTFQVLSPDDVAFKLPSSQNFNETVIEEMDHRMNAPDEHSICVTLSNTSGILFLTFMTMIVVSLISSSIITARRCWLKRRKYGTSKKVVTKPISTVAIPPKKLLEQKQLQSSQKPAAAAKKMENSSK